MLCYKNDCNKKIKEITEQTIAIIQGRSDELMKKLRIWVKEVEDILEEN